MGRIRTIKPEFPLSETVGRLSREARLLFVQLFTIADDSGRARAASRMLASLLYPYDEDAPGLMDGWLRELETAGCICLYQVDGTHYLEIIKWLKHQKIDKPSPSKLPAYSASPREASPSPREASPLDLGPRIKDSFQGTKDSFQGAKAPKEVAEERTPKEVNGYPTTVPTPEAQLFRRGKEVLGKNAGGLIARLLKGREGNVALARADIERASTKQSPREWIGRVLTNVEKPGLTGAPWMSLAELDDFAGIT